MLTLDELDELNEMAGGLVRFGCPVSQLKFGENLRKEAKMNSSVWRGLAKSAAKVNATQSDWWGHVGSMTLDDVIVELMSNRMTWRPEDARFWPAFSAMRKVSCLTRDPHADSYPQRHRPPTTAPSQVGQASRPSMPSTQGYQYVSGEAPGFFTGAKSQLPRERKRTSRCTDTARISHRPTDSAPVVIPM